MICIITNQLRTMINPRVTFIKVNPCSTQKTPVLQPIFSKELVSGVSSHFVEPICIHCQKCLRKQIKIKTGNVNYCVGCFSSILPYCQSYQVISHFMFEVIGGGWPARDEVLLLQAIQRLGFGNWAEIQEYMAYMGANYFADQIQLHYDKFYGKNQEMISHISKDQRITKVPNASRKNNKTQIRGGKFLEKSTAISFSNQNYSQRQEIACYNSKRGQFNIEYKENLQKYIADLEFKENDSQKETQLKFKILQAYNLGLEDRIKKHNFILQHKLLDQNYQAELNNCLQLNPYTNKAHQLLIDLMRTMTHEQYLELRKSIEFCLKIQAIIDNLRAIRSSDLFCSIGTLGRIDKIINESAQQMGKPRKRVHKDPQASRDDKQKAILKKLNMNKDQLRRAIEKARQQNQTVFYKDVKITPLNNLSE